jgi:hypothetical protein
MRLKLILTTAIVGTALALPSVSNAAPPAPTFQDSVSLTVTPAFTSHFNIEALNATSGPGGENPSGQIDFFVLTGTFVFHIAGPVTCLAVTGNSAVINVQDTGPGAPRGPGLFGIVNVFVVDDQPDIFDAAPIGRAPTDCSPVSPTSFAGPLISGDIKVVDAQVPTTKDQCKNGHWHNYPQFKNEGQCIAFVNHGP